MTLAPVLCGMLCCALCPPEAHATPGDAATLRKTHGKPWRGAYGDAKLPEVRFTAPTVRGKTAAALIRAGRTSERQGDAHVAASLYMLAATFETRLGDLLNLKAAALLLGEPVLPKRKDAAHKRVAAKGALGDEEVKLLQAIRKTGVLERPVLDRGFLQARVDAALDPDRWPTKQTAHRALHGPERDTACLWLEHRLNPQGLKTWAAINQGMKDAQMKRAHALFRLMHRRCADVKGVSPAATLGVPITAHDRLARTGMLLGRVRFTATVAELDSIPKRDLLTFTKHERCLMTYRKARALFRLRKRKKEADPLYKEAAKLCTGKKSKRMRLKSLYAAAKNGYFRGQNDEPKALFETILKEYPRASHADDAMFFLARIARRQDRRADEIALLRRAAREHPGGDMVRELAWEVYEPLYRAKKWRAFIRAIDGLKLLDRFDPRYYSQGRLLYFTGRAHEQLGAKRAAKRRYQKIWKQYPFSFYGYMAWLSLVRLGVPARTLQLKRGPLVGTWLRDPTWTKTPAALLAANGLFDWAAQYERLRLQSEQATESDWWRLAYLLHRAGEYPASHNLARRKMLHKSPWATPDADRTLRWTIAWPNPFHDLLSRSLKAERKQHNSKKKGKNGKGSVKQKLDLREAFPLAIMREESSFIPSIESYAGALGLMQLMIYTARNHDRDIKGKVTKEKLRLPVHNIRVAVDHIAWLDRRVGHHPALMAGSYNAGAGAIRRYVRKYKTDDIALWVEDLPYLQVRDYTKRVIGSYLAYQWLLGADRFDTRVGKPPAY